jgi:hypothetical protein
VEIHGQGTIVLWEMMAFLVNAWLPACESILPPSDSMRENLGSSRRHVSRKARE